MSLYEIERLIDRIEDHLKPDANLALVRQDAQEFTDWCIAVNNRIDLIMDMIKSNDPYQAMQLAQAEPPLMEMIGLITFKDLPAWRDLLEKQNLEKPPEIKKRALPMLNELFTQNNQHLGEYWENFNGWMIKGNSAEALNILHQILKIAPDDQNANDNLEALEKLDFKNRFERLEEALQANDRNRVLSEVGGIWPLMKRFERTESQSRIWLQAKCVEVDVWLGELMTHHANGEWQMALRYYREITKSITQNRLQLPAEMQAKLEEAGNWAEGQEADSNEEREFNEHYHLLQDWLGKAKLRNREPGLLDEKTCRLELNQLCAAWDKCHQFSDRLVGRIDQGVANHYQQRTRALQARIDKFIFWRRVKIAAACSLFVIVLTIIFFRANKSRGERDFVQEIKTEMAATNVLATSNLVVKGELDYPNPPENVSKAISDGREFITKEENKYKALDQLIKLLEERTNTLKVASMDVVTWDRFFADLQKATATLLEIAPDIKGPLDLRMAHVESAWKDFLAEFIQKAEFEMKNKIDRITKDIEDGFWKPEPDLTELKNLITDLESRLAKLNIYRNRPWTQVQISDELIAAYDNVVRKVQDRKTDLAKHNKAILELKATREIGDYRRILGDLKDANLLDSDERIDITITLTDLEDQYAEEILLKLVFEGSDAHYRAVREQQKELFPQKRIPLDVINKLNKAAHYALINDLMVLKQNAFILAVRPEQFTRFYIFGDADGKWWGINPNGTRHDWGDPNVQRRWDLALVNQHFQKPLIIQQNQDFEKGGNGLFGKVIRENVVDDRKEYAFKGAPVEYMANICEAINTGKMEPMIGAWKLKQFFKSLFPKQQEDFRPSIGDSLWRYGMPRGFAVEFEGGLLKGALLENQSGRELEAHTWMAYHPDSVFITMPPDDYKGYKERISKFSNDYKSSFSRLSELRKVYDEITKSGIEFIGYYHAPQGVNLVNQTNNKHIIGLSPAGEWIKLGEGNDKVLAFSPLFVLSSDFGLGIRKLPEIPDKWHKFPPILSY